MQKSHKSAARYQAVTHILSEQTAPNMHSLSFGAFMLDRYVVLVSALNLIMNPGYDLGLRFLLFAPVRFLQTVLWPRCVSRMGTMWSFRASLASSACLLIGMSLVPRQMVWELIGFLLISLCRPCDPALLVALSGAATQSEFLTKARSRAAAKHAGNPMAMFVAAWMLHSEFSELSFQVFYATAGIMYALLLLASYVFDPTSQIYACAGQQSDVSREVQSMYAPNEVRPVTRDNHIWPMFMYRMGAESIARTMTENLALATIMLFSMGYNSIGTDNRSGFYMAFNVLVIEICCLVVVLGLPFSIADRNLNFGVQFSAGVLVSACSIAAILFSPSVQAVFIMFAVPYAMVSYTSESHLIEAVRATITAADTRLQQDRKTMYYSFYHDYSTEFVTAVVFLLAKSFSSRVMTGSAMGCACIMCMIGVANRYMYRNFRSYSLVDAIASPNRAPSSAEGPPAAHSAPDSQHMQDPRTWSNSSISRTLLDNNKSATPATSDAKAQVPPNQGLSLKTMIDPSEPISPKSQEQMDALEFTPFTTVPIIDPPPPDASTGGHASEQMVADVSGATLNVPTEEPVTTINTVAEAASAAN